MIDMSWGHVTVSVGGSSVGECRQGGVRVTSEPGASKEVYATGGLLVAFSQAEPKITIEAEAFTGTIPSESGAMEGTPAVSIVSDSGASIGASKCAVTMLPDFSDDKASATKYHAVVLEGFYGGGSGGSGGDAAPKTAPARQNTDGMEVQSFTIDELANIPGARSVPSGDGGLTVIFGECEASIGGMSGDCKQGSVQVTGTAGSMLELYNSKGQLVAVKATKGKVTVRASYIEAAVPEKLVQKGQTASITVDGTPVFSASNCVCSYLPGYSDTEGFWVTAEAVLLPSKS